MIIAMVIIGVYALLATTAVAILQFNGNYFRGLAEEYRDAAERLRGDLKELENRPDKSKSLQARLDAAKLVEIDASNVPGWPEFMTRAVAYRESFDQ